MINIQIFKIESLLPRVVSPDMHHVLRSGSAFKVSDAARYAIPVHKYVRMKLRPSTTSPTRVPAVERRIRVSKCPCGGDHNSYNENVADYATRRSMFNTNVARYAMKLDYANFVFLVMDAARARTTTALIDSGIKPKQITAFTWCPRDYINIRKLRLGCAVRHTRAFDEYSLGDYDSRNLFVVHDCMTTWSKTREDIAKLLTRSANRIFIIINVVTRPDRSHHEVVTDVETYARANGYTGTCMREKLYGNKSGAVMWQFIADLKKI